MAADLTDIGRFFRRLPKKPNDALTRAMQRAADFDTKPCAMKAYFNEHKDDPNGGVHPAQGEVQS